MSCSVRLHNRVFSLWFVVLSLQFAVHAEPGLNPEALDAYNCGLYQEAISLLNQHLKKNPEDLNSRVLLASAYFKIKRFEEAVKECKRVLGYDSTQQEAKRILSQAQTELKKEREAKLAYYQRILEKHPESLSVRLALARLYLQEENYAEAERNYQRYLKGNPFDRDPWFEYAQVLSWQRKNSQAIAIYRKLLKEQPKDVKVRIALGYALLWSGRSDEAKREFSAALRDDPTSIEAREGLKSIAALSRSAAYAYPIDRYYSLLTKDPKNNRLRLILIKELLKANRFQEAYNQCQKLLTFEPDHPEGKRLLKEIDSLGNEFHQERVGSLTDYVKSHPEDLEARLNLALSLSFLGRYGLAVSHLKEYLKARPKAVSARLELARCLFNNGDIDEALLQYQTVLETWPKSLQVRLEYAQGLFWRDRKKAEKELLFILTQQPDYLTARLALADLYLAAGDLERSKREYEKVLQTAPGNKDAEQGLRNIEIERHKETERELLEKLNVAREAASNKDYPAAMALYEEYLRENPLDYSTKLEYARVLSWAKEYEMSVDVYQEILTQSPNDPDLRAEFAQVLYWQGDYLQAAKEYEKTIALFPKESVDVKVLLGLADAYREMGEYEKAKREYQKVLRINPSANIAIMGLKLLPRDEGSGHLWSFPIINAQYLRLDAPKDFHIYSKRFSGKMDLGSNVSISPGYQHYNFRQFDTNYYCNSYFFLLDYKFDPRLSARLNLAYNLYTNNTTFQWRFPAFSIGAEYKITPDVYLGLKYERRELIYAKETLPALQESLFGEKIGLNGEYHYTETWRFKGQYQYGVYCDANQSQELLLGTAYNLVPELSIGYDYNNWNYKDSSPFYWAPRGYQTHEFWANFSKSPVSNIDLYTKFGVVLVPGSSSWEKNLDLSVYWTPWANLTLGAVFGFSTRQRDLRRSFLLEAIFYF